MAKDRAFRIDDAGNIEETERQIYRVDSEGDRVPLKLVGEDVVERSKRPTPQPVSEVPYAVFRQGSIDEAAGLHIIDIITEEGNTEIPPGQYGFKVKELSGVFIDLRSDSSWVEHLRSHSDINLDALVESVNGGNAQVMRIDEDGFDSWYIDLKLNDKLDGRMYKDGKRVKSPDDTDASGTYFTEEK